MTDLQKDGLLLFDKMSVRTSLTLDPKTLKADGYTDLEITGENAKTRELIDHALVLYFLHCMIVTFNLWRYTGLKVT